MPTENKKHKVLEELLKICEDANNLIFDNSLVKAICKQVGFGNPFDVTKIDCSLDLPDVMIKNDYALIHLGEGRHQFIKGIVNVFHKFEDIPNEMIIEWKYRKAF